MENFYIAVHSLSILILLLVLGMKPESAPISQFELSRRAKAGDKEAKKLLARESKLRDVLSLQQVIVALLLIVISLVGVTVYQWGWGAAIAVVVALEAGALARAKPLSSLSQNIYVRLEPRLLRAIKKCPLLFKLIRSVSISSQEAGLSSKEELIYLVEQSIGILSDEDKKLIQNGLNFDGRRVNEIMISKNAVDTVKKTEILGPVVLNDLHKTGHSSFPVIDRDINHVVGVLHVQDLLVISGDSQSSTVEKVMEKKAYYIDQNKSLGYALAVFVKTKHHLLIVVNKIRETVGIITFEDVVEALIGRKVAGEFNGFDELRKAGEKSTSPDSK
jgi:CBS domain containing-hemolysin-like protein